MKIGTLLAIYMFQVSFLGGNIGHIWSGSSDPLRWESAVILQGENLSEIFEWSLYIKFQLKVEDHFYIIWNLLNTKNGTLLAFYMFQVSFLGGNIGHIWSVCPNINEHKPMNLGFIELLSSIGHREFVKAFSERNQHSISHWAFSNMQDNRDSWVLGSPSLRIGWHSARRKFKWNLWMEFVH